MNEEVKILTESCTLTMIEGRFFHWMPVCHVRLHYIYVDFRDSDYNLSRVRGSIHFQTF